MLTRRGSPSSLPRRHTEGASLATAGTGNSRLATKTIQECSFCAQLRLEAHTRRENSQQSRDAPQLFLPILFILRNSFGIFGIRLLGFERGEFWEFWDFIWDSNEVRFGIFGISFGIRTSCNWDLSYRTQILAHRVFNF